eukprot:TRINITY_DN15260_c0_g1_i2.p1 TRINITY_DN15260_c0_g1~~TRINITY_DN15260_c0_g1_i2.p1  ORF type:complete len:191 (+),score=60.45 TRINITY_DN15260_c0_g1_i2:101-673(+)
MPGDDLKFYKHREWKPGTDAAPAPVPVKVMDAPAPTTASPTGESAWNAAGTWEERGQKAWATEHLKKLLVGLSYQHDGYGEVKVTELEVTGDASITFTRGKKKWPYDFKLEFKISGPDSMKCEVVIPDFACDESPPFDMDFSWKGDDEQRKPEGKQAVGASSSQVNSGKGLFAEVHKALEQWFADFKTTC